jgi:transcriptional regulator with XRE-family HTH domain
MHEAVCAHLGIMPPRAVIEVRKQFGISRQDFSEVTKIGEASLSRWERGVGVQNAALDQLLYLLTFRENYVRLKAREPRAEIVAARARGLEGGLLAQFPNLKNPQRDQTNATSFQLRKTGI